MLIGIIMRFQYTLIRMALPSMLIFMTNKYLGEIIHGGKICFGLLFQGFQSTVKYTAVEPVMRQNIMA